MRTVLKSLVAVALVVPAVTFAAITNTKHDLSNVNTLVSTRSAAGATGSDQTCIFCHTPHRATVQALIWNRAPTAVAAYTWGAEVRTNAGTTLATTLNDKSKVCLSCHDGSISLGQVANSNGAAATFAMVGNVNASGQLTGGSVMGAAGAMSGNHPVSIPYPMTLGSTYNGITSQVNTTAELADYVTTSTTCTNSTGACTASTDGAFVNLYQPATGVGLGIECGSCHDVHNKYPGNTYFLRVSTASSRICKACHVK